MPLSEVPLPIYQGDVLHVGLAESDIGLRLTKGLNFSLSPDSKRG